MTSEPRLKYYTTNNEFKGEISLTKDVYAELMNKEAIKLVSPRKDFIMFEITKGEAREWVRLINEAIEKFSGLNK